MNARLVGPGIGWVETEHSLLVTVDDGQTWRDASPRGLSFDATVENLSTVRALAAVDGHTAFIASDAVGASKTTVRLWTTSDAGRSWRWTDLPAIPHLTGDICGEECISHGHADVEIDAVDEHIALADLTIRAGMDSSLHAVFRTLDGGTSWHELPWTITTRFSNDEGDTRISFLSADIGSVVFGARIFSTGTGWGNWTEFDQPRLPDNNVIANWSGPVRFLDDTHWIIAGDLLDATGTIPIAVSSDAGNTWTFETRVVPLLPEGDPDVDLAFIDPTTWVVSSLQRSNQGTGSTPAQIWISADAGDHWRLIGDQPFSIPSGTAFADAAHAWTYTSGGTLAATSDGGGSWLTILR